MPNGVIWAGAVDGSNHVGAIGDVPGHDGLASGSLRGCQGDHRQDEGDRGEQAGETMRSDFAGARRYR